MVFRISLILIIALGGGLFWLWLNHLKVVENGEIDGFKIGLSKSNALKELVSRKDVLEVEPRIFKELKLTKYDVPIETIGAVKNAEVLSLYGVDKDRGKPFSCRLLMADGQIQPLFNSYAAPELCLLSNGEGSPKKIFKMINDGLTDDVIKTVYPAIEGYQIDGHGHG